MTNAITRHHRPPPRGLAMLLVLVCLATATILASSYLASRDNSGIVGANVSSAAQARWAATSGIKLAVATFETEADWRTASADGVLMQDMAVIPGVTVTVEVVDAVTGGAVTDDTDVVTVTSIAVANGVEQVSTSTVQVTSMAEQDGVVDLGMDEFALLTSGQLRLQDRATIARWSESPHSKKGEAINVGTLSGSAGSVDLQGDAATLGVTVWGIPGASGALVSNGSGTTFGLEELPFVPGIAGSPEPSTRRPLLSDLFPVLTLPSGTLISADIRLGTATVAASGTMTLNGGGTLTVNHDLELGTNARVVVVASSELVVYGDLIMNPGSTIELVGSSAELDLHVGGEVRMQDAYIGDFPADGDSWTPDGTSRYFDATRLRVWSNDEDAGTNWTVRGASVLKGIVHAPDAQSFRLEDTSALYGRATAPELRLSDDAALFYDPKMNANLGITNLDGPLYDVNGDLKKQFDPITSITDYSDTSMKAMADLVGADVRMMGKRIESASDDDSSKIKDPGAGMTPTSRRWRAVEKPLDFGWKRDRWEKQVKGDGG